MKKLILRFHDTNAVIQGDLLFRDEPCKKYFMFIYLSLVLKFYVPNIFERLRVKGLREIFERVLVFILLIEA